MSTAPVPAGMASHGVHPLLAELRHRGPDSTARGSRGSAATSGIRAPRATSARRRRVSTTTRTTPTASTAPLRRRPDGSFEQISWETAIREIAEKLVAIRDTHGGRALAYYGGGGQGNHLGGVYGHGLVEAMRTRYHYSALAQEKTGDFWVNGRLFGRQTCHMTEAWRRPRSWSCIGANPWQAHGIRNARTTLHEIAKDPARTLVVIDPRRTETAAMADIHLQVRPGTDAFLLAAILATLVREGLEDREFLAARTTGFEAVRAALLEVPVEAWAARAGVAVEDVVRVAASPRRGEERLGAGGPGAPAEPAQHAQLVPREAALPPARPLRAARLQRPPYLPAAADRPLRGSGAEQPELDHDGDRHAGDRQAVPAERPARGDRHGPSRPRPRVWWWTARTRPSPAPTPRPISAAFSKLELLVVIDVALTETARHAHYVLPAASQLEKWETTFFNLEFPTQVAHLRRPIFAPRAETLPEPEIYRRLLVAMGELPAGGFPLLRQVARLDRRWPRPAPLPGRPGGHAPAAAEAAPLRDLRSL